MEIEMRYCASAPLYGLGQSCDFPESVVLVCKHLGVESGTNLGGVASTLISSLGNVNQLAHLREQLPLHLQSLL